MQAEDIQVEDLQENDEQVMETWTGRIKACTCDCESAESPTAIPAALPPSLQPLPPQGHSLNCMPGKDP